MKLNNHGWGTTELLIISGILFLGLLFVFFEIYNFYGNNRTSNNQYDALIEKMEISAKKYYRDIDSKKRISVSDLKSTRLLSGLSDYMGNPCDGYVLVDNNTFKGYIKCPYFKSKNYNKKYE